MLLPPVGAGVEPVVRRDVGVEVFEPVGLVESVGSGLGSGLGVGVGVVPPLHVVVAMIGQRLLDLARGGSHTAWLDN